METCQRTVNLPNQSEPHFDARSCPKPCPKHTGRPPGSVVQGSAISSNFEMWIPPLKYIYYIDMIDKKTIYIHILVHNALIFDRARNFRWTLVVDLHTFGRCKPMRTVTIWSLQPPLRCVTRRVFRKKSPDPKLPVQNLNQTG